MTPDTRKLKAIGAPRWVVLGAWRHELVEAAGRVADASGRMARAWEDQDSRRVAMEILAARNRLRKGKPAPPFTGDRMGTALEDVLAAAIEVTAAGLRAGKAARADNFPQAARELFRLAERVARRARERKSKPEEESR